MHVGILLGHMRELEHQLAAVLRVDRPPGLFVFRICVSLLISLCVCACVRACMHACMHACVFARARACVRAYVRG